MTAATLLLLLASCDSITTVEALECTLTAGPHTLSIGSTVDYEVTLTGDGDVDSITYEFGDDSETITNPTLPWSATKQVDAGAEVSLTAKGRVMDGRFASSIEADGSDGDTEITVTLDDDCEQSL